MPDTDRLINKAQGDDIITALNGITSRLQEMYTVDSALSSTSEHPVQNKVVKAALDDKADESELADKADKSDIASTKTAYGNPITLTDCAPINAESLVVELEPKQDLHGQSAPYVGGAGKNKLNTATTTTGGITFTEDANGYISASPNNADSRNWGYSNCQYIAALKAGTYNIDWWASTLSSSQYKAICVFDTSDNMLVYAENFGESGTSQFTLSQDAIIGVEAKILDSIIRIQIRESTEEQVYSPWENICPITGYTECDVESVGKNRWNAADYTTNKLIDNGVIVDSIAGAWLGERLSVNGDTVYLTISKRNSYNNGSISVWASADDVTFTQVVDVANTKNIQDGYTTSGSLPNGTKYIRISGYMGGNNSGKYIDTIEGMVSTVDSQYEPYHSSNATIQFGQTVYGGKSNFTEGGTNDEYVKIVGVTVSAVGQTGSGVRYADTTHIYGNLSQNAVTISDRYSQILTSDQGKDGNFRVYQGEFTIYDNRFTDTATAQSLLNDVEFCYKKNSATSIATPPTDLKLLKGTNHITTNGTTINLGYQPDNSIGDAVKASEEYTDRRFRNLDLDDISNVDITNPANGEVLKYDAVNHKWINAAGSGGGGGTWSVKTLTFTANPTSVFNHNGIYAISFGEKIFEKTSISGCTTDTIMIFQGMEYVIGGSGYAWWHEMHDFDCMYIAGSQAYERLHLSFTIYSLEQISTSDTFTFTVKMLCCD